MMTAAPRDGGDRRKAAVWLERAERASKAGRPVREAAALRAALRFEPAAAATQRRLARVLLGLRKPRRAAEPATEAWRLDPGSVESLHLHGLILFYRRRFRDAAARFADWTHRQPDEPRAWFMLARARFLSGDRGVAREACGKALDLAPDDVRGHLLMARIASMNDNHKVQIAHLKAAADLRPASVTLRIRLIEAMLLRVQNKAALVVAQEALAAAPDSVVLLLILARCHVALGQLAKAQAILDGLDRRRADPAGIRQVRSQLAARRTRGPAAQEPEDRSGRVAPALDLPAAAPPPKPLRKPVPVAVSADRPAPAPVTKVSAPERRSKPSERFQEPWPGVDFTPFMRQAHGPGLVDNVLIIRALILRDLRVRYRDSRLGVAVELIRPIAVVLAHVYLFWLIRKPMPGEIPLEAYVLAGFASWFAFNSTAQGASSGAKWTAGVTALPGISRLHLRVARAVWPLLLNLVFCLVALIPVNLLGGRLPLPGIPLTVLVFAIAGGMGFGFGALSERIGHIWPLFKTMEKLLSWGLFVTSGLYFSLASMPPAIAVWFWYNPLLHLVEYERHAFDAGYPIALLDLRYPTVIMLVLLLTGLIALKCLPQPAQD